jgi:DNA invertase Pin-like site-specific DNA recombinase
MHGCDNPPCVNPAHLKIGDLLENNRDMFIKRRHAFGTRNGQSRLDPSKVSEIRKLAKDGTPHGKIAEIFSVSRQTVTKIAGEKSWRSHG